MLDKIRFKGFDLEGSSFLSTTVIILKAENIA